MVVRFRFDLSADPGWSQTMTTRNIMSQTFTIDELLRHFRVACTARQFAEWIDRGSFRSFPGGDGTAKTRRYSVRDGLSASLLVQHVSVICPSTEAAATIANRAAGEIMKSPAFKILTDPNNAPIAEYLLVIARADIWVVRVVRQEELDFSHAYTSIVINLSQLLRDIAESA
ncbi:MAG: hypothetical protein ACI8W7_005095 [Gammaproteobacteria bacterium]|jgi:hypothetical protein